MIFYFMYFINLILSILISINSSLLYAEEIPSENHCNHETIIYLIITLVIFIILIRQEQLQRYNKKLKQDVEIKIKELRDKDKILLQKHKLSLMGEMLGMIAHQWHQPLSAISSSIINIEINLKSGKFDLDDKESRELFFKLFRKKHRGIKKYIQYLAHTTNDFRNFFNPNKSREFVRITTPIDNALRLVSKDIKENEIKIIKGYKNNQYIYIYPNEIMHVILNLIKNSVDSFFFQNIEKPEITIITEEIQEKLIIKICDNGGGIEEDILNQVFNPYFTTKSEKHGTGLGLYISKIIVEEHHDAILELKNTSHGVCISIIFNSQD